MSTRPPPDASTMAALEDELAEYRPLHPEWNMYLSVLGCPWATCHGITLRADSPRGLHVKIDTWVHSHAPLGGAA